MLKQLQRRLRRDSLPLILYVLTIVIMTYPFVFVMHEHLPLNNADTHSAIWQNWWAYTALQNNFDITYTHLMFSPYGIDLTILPPRWLRLAVWMPLFHLFGDPIAYNLTAMFGLLLKAYGMYLFCLWLFKNRIPAWVSGAFFSCGSAMLQVSLTQPMTGSMEWIPFFMLAFAYGIEQTKGKAKLPKIVGLMLLAALLFVFSVYINLKIGIFAMLLGGGYVLLKFFWDKLWMYRSFWIAMVVFGCSAFSVSLPGLLPLLGSDDLNAAIDSELEGMGIDIVNYVKPMQDRPLNYTPSIATLSDEYVRFNNLSSVLDTPYVGIVAVVFALMGVVYATRVDHRVFIWLLLSIAFLVLSFGLRWMWNGMLVDLYWTPIRLLQDNFIVVVLKWMYRWTLLFWFPFSILIGYGLLYRLQNLILSLKQTVLLVISVTMLLHGTSIFPIFTRPFPTPDYLQVLDELPSGSIVNLPLGRQESKYYMIVQTQHVRPMNEGMIARLPQDTYKFHHEVPLLAIFRGEMELWEDQASANVGWRRSMEILRDNGFRYVVLHKRVWTKGFKKTQEWVIKLFKDSDPIHEDELAFVYDIEDLLTSTPSLP